MYMYVLRDTQGYIYTYIHRATYIHTQLQKVLSMSPSFPHRGHVVCLPFPAQSHIGAMLKISKLLHSRGFYVSFINSQFNHRRLVEAQHEHGFQRNMPTAFQLVAISDGLPPSQANASQSPEDMAYAAQYGMTEPFCELIEELNRKAKGVASVEGDDGTTNFPSVSCIISDGFMTFPAKAAADKYQLPNVYLWTISAFSLLGFMQGPDLIRRGLCPIKDESYLDTVVDWIDGLPSMRLRDLPTFIRVADLRDTMLNFIIDTTNRVNEATSTIIHTVEALEKDVLGTLSLMLSGPIYTVGPLNTLLNQIPQHDIPIGSNLMKEDVNCLKWLNSQTNHSVLYINFGSHAYLTRQEFEEFAMGIANSKQSFLWIIRPDMILGDEAIILAEFIEMTKGRCYISSWCPQEDVLAHPSISGFLTHCGWNSILESLSIGVPMLCRPFFGDQQTNCKYVCDEWGVGFEINHVVTRDNVELLVREIMGGDKGKKLKRNAMRWKKIVNEAANSSGKKFDKLFPIP